MAFFRLFGPTNLWVSPTTILTASSASPGLPGAASQNPDRTYVWRSGSLQADQSLTVDLGSSVNVNAAAIANVVLMNGGSVKLQQAGTAEAPGAWVDVATMPVQNVDRRVSFSMPTPTAARHWRLLWVNGNPGAAAVAEVGYVYLGAYTSFSYTPDAPIDIVDVDPSVGRASVDGQQTFVERTSYATGKFRMSLIPEADLEALKAMRRAYGARTPFVGVFNDAISWQAWLMRFRSEVAVLAGKIVDFYDVEFSWEEAR